MPFASAAGDASVSPEDQHASTIALVVTSACLIWYCIVWLVSSIGFVQLCVVASLFAFKVYTDRRVSQMETLLPTSSTSYMGRRCSRSDHHPPDQRP